MTLQDILCFLKLAETLNYTKTAEQLFISQPAVSRHINSLESDLGFKLLDRSVRRNVVLTEAGREYYKGLKKCSDLYQTTVSKITEKAAQSPLYVNLLRGTQYPDSYITATNQFMLENPAFLHFMNFIDADAMENALSRGEIILCPREYIPSDKGYKSMKLTNQPVRHCILASKHHPAFTNDNQLNFDELRKTTLFLPKDTPASLKEIYFSELATHMKQLPEEIMYLDSLDSVILFLRSGRCFTICSEWTREILSSELVSYPLSSASDYYAFWDAEAVSNPFIDSYLKQLKASK